MTETLRTGSLAYYDAWGLYPCKVVSITGQSATHASSNQDVVVRLTASKGPYKHGEVIRSSALWVVPRKAVHRRKYQTTVRSYHVECDA